MRVSCSGGPFFYDSPVPPSIERAKKGVNDANFMPPSHLPTKGLRLIVIKSSQGQPVYRRITGGDRRDVRSSPSRGIYSGGRFPGGPGTNVPRVGRAPDAGSKIGGVQKVSRAPPVPTPTILPRVGAAVVARDWIEYWDLTAKGISVSPPAGQAIGKTPDIFPKEVPEVATIGSVIGDLATTYIQTRYGQAPPQVIMANQPMGPRQPSGPMMGNAGLDIPFVDVIPEAFDPCKRQVWDPKANCGNGKWILRGRRRRRRLATASDISDLSSLKTVLGPKGLQTWIATHRG